MFGPSVSRTTTGSKVILIFHCLWWFTRASSGREFLWPRQARRHPHRISAHPRGDHDVPLELFGALVTSSRLRSGTRATTRAAAPPGRAWSGWKIVPFCRHSYPARPACMQQKAYSMTGKWGPSPTATRRTPLPTSRPQSCGATTLGSAGTVTGSAGRFGRRSAHLCREEGDFPLARSSRITRATASRWAARRHGEQLAATLPPANIDGIRSSAGQISLRPLAQMARFMRSEVLSTPLLGVAV